MYGFIFRHLHLESAKEFTLSDSLEIEIIFQEWLLPEHHLWQGQSKLTKQVVLVEVESGNTDKEVERNKSPGQ